MTLDAVRRTGTLVASALTAAVVAVMVVAPPSAAQDPPGNNGTIKIDGADVEGVPDNDPHNDCRFTLEFRGYDQGDLEATVRFELVPPTERPAGSQTLLDDTLAIGGDPAGGATDLDAARAYELDFTGAVAHEAQGFHVRVTIHAEGSRGADVKHKVFWVQPCPPPVTTTTTTSTTTTSTTTTSTTTTTAPTSPTTTATTTVVTVPTQVAGVQLTQPAATTTTVPTQVLGTQLSRLPATGPGPLTGALLVTAGLFLVLGAGILTVVRPRDE